MNRAPAMDIPTRSFAAPGPAGARFGTRSAQTAAGHHCLHRHDYYEVLIFGCPGAPQRIAIAERIPQAGSMFFLSPMQAHEVSLVAGSPCFVLYFDLPFLHPDLANAGTAIDADRLGRAPELAPFVYQGKLDFILPGAVLDYAMDMCRRMLGETQGVGLCAVGDIRSTLHLLLAEVTQHYEVELRQVIRDRPPYQWRDGVHRRQPGAQVFPQRCGTRGLRLAQLSGIAVETRDRAHLRRAGHRPPGGLRQ